ncbi:MAG TPA: exopolysaccharide biosynthesis protein [Rhizomicrobium sp.]|nr:exopolysaccharide biosynthesis protein [Rhizomicrobium sp.]
MKVEAGPAGTEPHSLNDVLLLLRNICSKNRHAKVSVDDILKSLGPRSFAPLVLAVGLIAVTPIDSIPSLPTTFGAIIFLTVGQMLLGRRSLWLPHFVSGRAVNADRLDRALVWLEPRARRVDRLIGPRLVWLTQGWFLVMMALCCLVLAATMPFLELIPLLSTIPALAFTAFGVALLLHDGIAALLGFVFTAATFLLIFQLVRLPF